MALGETLVKRVTTVKYLGVTLDQFLNFSDYVTSLVKKASAKVSFLYRHASVLDQYTRKLLCQSLVNSNLEYCSSAWYPGLSVSLRGKLDVIQRKLVRYILNLGPREHVGDLEILSLSWLPFPKRVRYFELVHAFKIKRGLAPSYLAINFRNITDVHSYGIRQNLENFSLARYTCPTGSFSRCSISSWNSLPQQLKEIRSIGLFKMRLKSHLANDN